MNPDKINCLGHTIYHTDRCQDCRRDFYNQFCPDYLPVRVVEVSKVTENPVPRECQGLMGMLEVDDG